MDYLVDGLGLSCYLAYGKLCCRAFDNISVVVVGDLYGVVSWKECREFIIVTEFSV